jgi:hypothetical protein
MDIKAKWKALPKFKWMVVFAAVLAVFIVATMTCPKG